MNTEGTAGEAQFVATMPADVQPAGDGSNGEGTNTVDGANGTGTGKSRRRRRKRKNRSATAAGAPAANGDGSGGDEAAAPLLVMEGESLAVAAERPRNPQQASGQNGNGQNGNGQPRPQQQNNQQPRQANGQQQQGEAGSRWKKKKFRRAAGPGEGQPQRTRPEPGNSIEGSHSGQGRRGRKQQGGMRGPRAFVGPMDHSYREVNGNYESGPASTINLNPGRRSNNHGRPFNEDRLPPELLSNHRAIAIPEDAPTHIYFFIEDLFFTAKIQEAAKLQGVKVAFMKGDKDVVANLADLPEHDHPSLIVIDLNNGTIKPLTLIPKLKAKLKKGTSIVGFLSHLQGDLKAKAMEAGCNTVMPRAAFSQNLPNLLRRYGVVEEDNEPNFNQ